MEVLIDLLCAARQNSPGSPPKPCDILEIPLSTQGPDFGFESENLSILPRSWRVAGSIPPEGLIPHRHCAHP